MSAAQMVSVQKNVSEWLFKARIGFLLLPKCSYLEERVRTPFVFFLIGM